MLRIGIVAAGAIFPALLIVSGMVSGSATAQTATDATPGKPIQLLQTVQQGKPQARLQARSAVRAAATKPSVNSRVAYRKKPRPHLVAAARGRHLSRPPIAEATASSAAPAAAATIAAATPPLAAAPLKPPGPSEVVAGGHPVQVASSDAGETLELSANNDNVLANETPPTGAALSAPPMRDVAEAPKSDSATVAVAQQQRGEIGGASWILQVLAALGGAITVGAIAWFLIGSMPQRTYG